MLRKNFTKSFLLDLKPRDKSYVVYDEAIRTLLIRVDPSGGKSFCFRKKADRKVHFKTIGSFPELTIENARMHAAEAASTVARWKADEDRRELPLAKAARPDTFGNTIEAYIDQHIKTVHKNNPERLAKATKTTRWVLDKYLRHLKNKPLGDIDKKTLWKLHAELTVDNGFVTANRVLSFIRTIFYWAIDTENFTGENPAKRFRKRFNITKDEKSRKRHLQEDELKRLAAALLTEPNRDLQHFVVIALGTGARRGDIFRMRWEQLDWKNHEWKVPNQKTEEDYVVYLQPAVEAVLEMRRNKSEWVFPSSGATGHLVDLKRAWKQLVKRADLKDFKVHDLRRTFATEAQDAGVPSEVTAKLLGHTTPAMVQKVYAQVKPKAVRAASELATRKLLP